MEQSDIEDAAMFLLHLRTQRDQVTGIPGELAPKTIDHAYDIQDALHRFAGWPISMLKVGCTSAAAQEFLGIPHPIGGRVPTEAVFASGATVPRAFLASEPLLECEIAVRVGAHGGVEAVAPAIELVNGRFVAGAKVAGPSLVADNSAGCAAILGEPVEVTDLGQFEDLAMTLSDGQVEIASGSTTALSGGPAASLEWALAHEDRRGRKLQPGMWIITGTCTGLTPTSWNTTYAADFGELGSVCFTLD